MTGWRLSQFAYGSKALLFPRSSKYLRITFSVSWEYSCVIAKPKWVGNMDREMDRTLDVDEDLMAIMTTLEKMALD